MAVKRIVANVAAAQATDAAKAFYADAPGLKVAMDMGWIVTFEADALAVPQLSVATEGGSGTAVPDLSIEVDDLDDAHSRADGGRLRDRARTRRRAVGRDAVLREGPVRAPREHSGAPSAVIARAMMKERRSRRRRS